MDVEAKLAAIAAAREEANARRVRLERLMGDAEARMGTRKPPGSSSSSNNNNSTTTTTTTTANAASEKESRVETERVKGGDETGEGDEPATSESLLESLPEWAGQVPNAIRETRELIRDMEERVKATAARLHDSLTKPPRPFEISDGETGEGERDGQPALTVEGDAEGTGQAQRGTVGPPPVCVRFGKRVRRRLGRGGLARPDAALGERARNDVTRWMIRRRRSGTGRLGSENARRCGTGCATELGLSDRFGEDEPPAPVPEMTWHKHAGVDGEEERFLPEDETGKLKHVRDFQSLMDYAFD